MEIDLGRLRRALARQEPTRRPRVVVGHLAQFLDVAGIVVLRCDPRELARRLARARRGSASERVENVGAEALDTILIEALGRGRPVWEVDTTGRTVASVAREVTSLLRRRPPTRAGRTHWLTDPGVTDLLLRQRG